MCMCKCNAPRETRRGEQAGGPRAVDTVERRRTFPRFGEIPSVFGSRGAAAGPYNCHPCCGKGADSGRSRRRSLASVFEILALSRRWRRRDDGGVVRAIRTPRRGILPGDDGGEFTSQRARMLTREVSEMSRDKHQSCV